jgi:hypothetical protein
MVHPLYLLNTLSVPFARPDRESADHPSDLCRRFRLTSGPRQTSLPVAIGINEEVDLYE